MASNYCLLNSISFLRQQQNCCKFPKTQSLLYMYSVYVHVCSRLIMTLLLLIDNIVQHTNTRTRARACVFNKSIIISVIALSFILQEIDEDREQHNADKSEHPYCINIKACLLPLKRIYSGDRFVPYRRGYSFEMAHHLLMKSDTTENTQTLDVCEQV